MKCEGSRFTAFILYSSRSAILQQGFCYQAKAPGKKEVGSEQFCFSIFTSHYSLFSLPKQRIPAMRYIVLTIIAGWCAAALGGCALQSDLLALNERIVLLEQQTKEVEQRTVAAKRELKSKIETYSKTQDEKEQTLRSQSAGLQATFDGLREEIQELRGKIEESDYLLKRQLETMNESNRKNETRVGKIEEMISRPVPSPELTTPPQTESGSVQMPSLKTGSSDPAVASEKPSAVKDDISEDELYEKAKQAFDRNDLKTALEGFKRILESYPKAKHADNAQFWLGEIYYKQKDYEKAILEYQTVIEKYPKGNKTKAAMLKQGFSFFNIGDRANARLILEELVQKYPNTHESKLAKEKLEWF